MRVFKSNRMFEIKHSKPNRLKKISNTKQMNRVQNIRVEVWKYKAVKCLEIWIGMVSPCSFRSNYLY